MREMIVYAAALASILCSPLLFTGRQPDEADENPFEGFRYDTE